MAGFRQINALWKQEGDAFACSEGTPFAPGQYGSVFAIQNTTGLDPGNSGKLAQYVKRVSTDTSTLITGQAVYWYATGGMDNFFITNVQSSAVGGTAFPAVAGFVQSTNPQPGSSGFIQVGGQGLVLVSDSTSASTTAAGRSLVIATNNTLGYVTQAGAGLSGTDATTLIVSLKANALHEEGKLLVGNNSTGTNITVEALISVERHGW